MKQLNDNELQANTDDGATAAPRSTVGPTNLLDIWEVLMRGKWLIVGTTAGFIALAIVYVWLATPWYRAEALLVEADSGSSPNLPGQLGGLAGLAGIAGFSVGGGGSVEPIAILKSRDFARSFIRDENLLPVFFADEWDSEQSAWKDADSSTWPDLRDGVKFFDENIRRVAQDPSTNLVTLSVEWTAPDMAAHWAELLVTRLNAHMRDRALTEANANVEYLQLQLAKSPVATLRQSIGSLLEAEMQRLMLARGREEFSFRFIDRPTIPKDPERPRPLILLVIGVIFGSMLSALFVLARHGISLLRLDRDSHVASD